MFEASGKKRICDLMKLIPKSGGSVIDIGARYGYIYVLLTDYFDAVTALDLDKPSIEH